MDRFRIQHCGDKSTVSKPVRRNTQNGVRFWDFTGNVAETLHKLVFFNRIHRRTVPEEKNRHFFSVIKLLRNIF